MAIGLCLLPSVVIGLLLHVVMAQTSKLSLSSNLAAKLTGSRAGLNFFTVATPTFTVDPNNNTLGQPAKEIVDLTFGDVYVLEKANSNDGIDCTTAYQCTTLGADTCGYQGQPVTCSKAASLMRFEPVAAEDKAINTLTFKLLTPDNDYLAKYGQNGVWGLSPKSTFWDFLEKTYKQNDAIDVSYRLAIKSDEDMYKLSTIELDEKSQVTLNGRLETTDQAFADFDTQYSAWVWPNAKVSLTSGKPNNSMAICVDNTINSYFLIHDDDFKTLRNHVYGQLCDLDEDSDDFCYKNNSNFANVDDMEITFNGNDKKSVNINLGAFDFIHYDNEETAIFGVDKLSKSSICSQQKDVRYAVGRLFFTKAELTIRSQGSGKFQVGFSKVKRETSIILPILLLVVGIILILAIGTIAYTQLPREEKKEDGEYEEAADSPAKEVDNN